jgi:isopenicillin N synthase-like dioxygenase
MTEISPQMNELRLEATLGGAGTDVDRAIPEIDMADFAARKAEIADQLWAAATDVGFFQVYNHGLAPEVIERAFMLSERFFALPQQTKAQYPLRGGTNAGWEFKAQVRPSTGTPDNKESYQITLPRMAGLWPQEEEIAGFRAAMLTFEQQNWEVGMRILSCFALKLGFDEAFFTRAHDRASPGYQSTQRIINYMGMEHAKTEDFGLWRAGAHTDFDCLTLLHQKVGQGGLQLCPGKDAASGMWTDVPPLEGRITCNIGDMLMRWSDDRLKSTLHRVRMPRTGEYVGQRLSMPFFCQANKEAIIAGPDGKYEPVSAHDYMQQRIAANF